VVSIKFHVTEKSPHILSKEDAEVFNDVKNVGEDEAQKVLEGIVDVDYVDVNDEEDPLALFASALPPELKFTREQIELLWSIAVEKAPDDCYSIHDVRMWCHNYLDAKVKQMKAYPNIDSPFGWLKAALMHNWT
jgi:hypothetical protein